MKIVKVDDRKTELRNMIIGSVFEIQGDYYICTDKEQDGLVFCVNLKNGHVMYLSYDTAIETVNSELHIS